MWHVLHVAQLRERYLQSTIFTAVYAARLPGRTHSLQPAKGWGADRKYASRIVMLWHIRLLPWTEHAEIYSEHLLCLYEQQLMLSSHSSVGCLPAGRIWEDVRLPDAWWWGCRMQTTKHASVILFLNKQNAKRARCLVCLFNQRTPDQMFKLWNNG